MPPRPRVLRKWLACLGSALLLICAGRIFAQTASQQTYLQCRTNFETCAETIWHTNSSGIPDAGYWGDGGNSGNCGIRDSSGIAMAYAVLCLAQLA